MRGNLGVHCHIALVGQGLTHVGQEDGAQAVFPVHIVKQLPNNPGLPRGKARESGADVVFG